MLVSNNTNVKNKASKKHQNKNNYRFRPNHGPHPVPPASALAPYLNNKRAPESDFLCCCWDHRTVSQRNQIWLYIISTLYVYIYKHPLSYSFSKENERIHRNSLLKSNWKLGAWSLGVVRSVPWPSLSPTSVIVTSCVVTMVIKMGPSFNPTRILLWTVNLLLILWVGAPNSPFRKAAPVGELAIHPAAKDHCWRGKTPGFSCMVSEKRHWKSLCTGIIKYTSLGSPSRTISTQQKIQHNIMCIYIYL